MLILTTVTVLTMTSCISTGVMCPPIQPPKYGSMDGASGCNKGREVPYNSYCLFRCSRKGFIRQGPRVTTCQPNGTWTVKSSSVLCKGSIIVAWYKSNAFHQ